MFSFHDVSHYSCCTVCTRLLVYIVCVILSLHTGRSCVLTITFIFSPFQPLQPVLPLPGSLNFFGAPPYILADSVTDLRFICCCLSTIIVTWWGEPGEIEACQDDWPPFFSAFDTVGWVIRPVSKYHLLCVSSATLNIAQPTAQKSTWVKRNVGWIIRVKYVWAMCCQRFTHCCSFLSVCSTC